MSSLLDRARAEMKSRFGFDEFRPGQPEVIGSVLSGRPTLAVMPTGAGKSLCFQLPALLSTGCAIVVAPLISLMKDQVDQLRARGAPCTFINSSLSDEELSDRLRRLRSGEFRLVYVAPERMRSQRFLDALDSVPVSLLAVDEAHCISTWGHDFRPDYAQLGSLRVRTRPRMTVALTATATPEVRRDIVRSLRMANPAIFVTGFERPNLALEVVRVGDEEERVGEIVATARTGGAGIVYTATRKHAERLARHLVACGFDASAYHAGLSDRQRIEVQEAFSQADASIIVATNAFGMGVDKADVRFVAHADIPRSVEAYYQEIGRGGRDGQPARAVLLFNHSSVFLQQALIRVSHPSSALVGDLWQLLRKQELWHVTISVLSARLGANEMEVASAVRLLERAGNLVRLQRTLGPAHVAIRDPNASVPNELRIVFDLLRSQCVGSAFRPVDLDVVSQASGADSEAIRTALRTLSRTGAILYRRPASGRGLKIVGRNTPLTELAIDFDAVGRRRERELLLLRRMTAYAYAKTCRWRFLLGYFGSGAARACGRCDRCIGPTPRPSLPIFQPRLNTMPRSQLPTDTRTETLRLHEQGATIPQIARKRGLRPGTIARHLGDLLRAGHAVDVDRIIPEPRRRLVLDVARSCGFRPPLIKRALPDDYTYEEIIVALASRRRDGERDRFDGVSFSSNGA